jgi:UDP-2-acetamido-3-amino-2,3-dideoxy-glucuronate N-acetyltransferase
VVILEGAKIGNNCNICSHVLIEGGVVIGNETTIKSGVQLWAGVHIGDHVFVGPNVTFTNDKYPVSRKKNFTPLTTKIEDHAVIGAGAVILPGITIGANAVIGAGAVVTKSVAPGATVIGNPARTLRHSGG